MNIPSSAVSYIEKQRATPSTADAAVNAMVEEAKTLAAALSGCKSVLDIGCGIGVVSSALSLLGFSVTGFDKTQNKKPREYGWTNCGVFYNDLEVAKEFSDANQASVNFVNEFPEEKFDAAISLYSWGFHYPLDLYSPDASRLIFDLRHNKENTLPGKVSVLSEGAKSNRLMVQR